MIRHLSALALITFAACNTVESFKIEERERPNIVFIFSDDHSTAAISAYGSRINNTPNLDRLAAEGMLFENTFCTNSICAPSRAVILTGKHSHLNSVPTNAESFDGSQTTFPKLLQAANYQTALVGKLSTTPRISSPPMAARSTRATAPTSRQTSASSGSTAVRRTSPSA
jgi:arylsulfatase A-like enzyme